MVNGDKLGFAPNEFCHALGIGRTLAYELMSSGAVKFVLIRGRRRIPRSEIERLLREGVPRDSK